MDLYIKEGIRLSEDTVAVESLAVALKRNPTGITEKTNSLLNIVTQSYCNRWNVPRVVIATESFHSTARAQASVVACEGIVELAKAGWKRFIEWLKGLIGKVTTMINHFKARGKSLAQKADQLEALIAKAGDLELKDLSGSWGKLTMDGQVGFQKPVAFLKTIKSDASGFAKRTTTFINLSLDGKNTLFDVPWQGPVTMKAQQIEGMNKPQILAMPNNTLMVVGQRNRKPVVEMKPIEGKTAPIRSGNKAALEFCLEGIDAGIEFLEDRSNEFKEFIGTIERLTKTDKLPFENHSGDKIDDEDVNYYIGLARSGILAGATFIQHIDRFVEAATTGLIEFCYESLKASSKKDSGKDYGITPVFTKAVEKNDVKSIHIMMKDSLLVDPSFEQFDEMARLAKDVKGLYQEHKEGGHFDPLDLDPSKWDDNYMNSLMVDVVDNFSHERLNHLKKVVRKLRPPK